MLRSHPTRKQETAIKSGFGNGLKFFACCILSACAATPSASLAAEGGTGHYLPGGIATIIDLAPTKPGWVVEPVYLHYDGSASASVSIPVATLAAAGLTAKSDAILLGGLHTFEQTVLGAHYSAGLYLPYVWISAEAQIKTPFGNRLQQDSTNGVGDMLLMPAMLAWKTGFWPFNTLLPVYAPTGGYQTGRLANPGLNYWTFDPIVGVSYNNDKIGLNVALHGGIAANTRNDAIGYTSGSMLHFEGSVQQLLPAGPGFLGLGAEAFYQEQVTADSGPGRLLGDFKGHTAGVGPTLTYILPQANKDTFVAEFRWLPEIDVKRRLNGEYFWLKMVYQF